MVVVLVIYQNHKDLHKLKKENEKLEDLVETIAKQYNTNNKLNVPGVSELENKKQKIMNYLDTHEMIVNDDVEQLLNVSDSLATKYLQMLEDDGKIVQIGERGRYVYYIKRKV
ncbi:MAG TPA: hypothetical protein P5241_00785 [Candidatus Paceibacterota bacterium]|nr:hypothetical protein [Candidatus Paceibacterota bacterium]